MAGRPTADARAPDFLCFTPCSNGHDKVRWRQIGEAWLDKKTGSISTRLDLPVQGNRMVMHPFDRSKPARDGAYDDIPPPGDQDAPIK